MDDRINRKKSLDKISSPEQLNDYIKVTNPGVWMILSAIIVLLIGVCIWGFFGRLETKLTLAAESENGETVVYIKEANKDSVKVNMDVRISDKTCSIVSVSSLPIAVSEDIEEYARHTGNLSIGEWVYVAKTDGKLPDGIYKASIVVDSVSPWKFIFN